MFKVLITGSSGFIGQNFISRSTDLIIVELDLISTKPEQIDFSGVDCVLHLAAIVHQTKNVSPEEYFRINRDLAYEVAVKAKANGVKQFIFLSTAKVYGESSIVNFTYNELSPCNPSEPYGKSKYEAEVFLRNLDDKSFKVVIVRSPLVYGPGVKANMYSLIRMVDKVRILPLNGITNLRSFVFVGNLVGLLQHIINTQVNGTFIAGDLAPISTTKLIEAIGRSLNKKNRLIHTPALILKVLKNLKPAVFYRIFGSLVLDNSETLKSLNFYPQYTTEEGINETVNWYQNQRDKN